MAEQMARKEAEALARWGGHRNNQVPPPNNHTNGNIQPNQYSPMQVGFGGGSGSSARTIGEFRQFPLLWCAFLGINTVTMVVSAYYLYKDEDELKEQVRLARSDVGGREKQLDVRKVNLSS